MNGEFKISGTGWLCYRATARSNWIVLFELTPAQLQEWLDFSRPKDHIRLLGTIG